MSCDEDNDYSTNKYVDGEDAADDNVTENHENRI